MNTKKIIIFSIIGFMLSGVFFGTILYFTVFRTSGEAHTRIVLYEYPMGSFSTNLGSQRNFFKGEIVIETSDKKLIDGFQNKNAELRDQIIKTIIGKKTDDILDPVGQQELRQEIIETVSRVMTTDKITNIYFVDYIIQ